MKTANKVISIIFYVLAAIFVCYSVYMIYYSASYISSIINSGYYSNVGFMDIMSVYFAQVSPYFFYACGFFGLGWVIGGNVQTAPAKKMKKVWVEVDDSDKTEDDASDKTEELPSEDSEDTAELQKNDAETEDKTETFDPAAAAEEDVREVVDKQKADGDELASEIAEDLGDDEKAEKDEMKAEVEDDKAEEAEEEKEEEKDSDK